MYGRYGRKFGEEKGPAGGRAARFRGKRRGWHAVCLYKSGTHKDRVIHLPYLTPLLTQRPPPAPAVFFVVIQPESSENASMCSRITESPSTGLAGAAGLSLNDRVLAPSCQPRRLVKFSCRQADQLSPAEDTVMARGSSGTCSPGTCHTGAQKKPPFP